MSFAPGPKFRVAICGAGIGGLVLAITIGKYDPSIPIDLYEAHDSIDTAGVGITLWPQVDKVMIDLGLFDDFKHIAIHSPESGHGPMFRRSDIPEGGYLWYQRHHRYAPSSAHRQHMVAMLEKRLPASCTVHPRKRLVNYTELEEEQDARSMSPIRLEFKDGTTATTDVLIGADGIRSAVRKILFETAASEEKADYSEYVDPVFTGMSTYRFLASAETLAKDTPENSALKRLTAGCGKGRYIIAYPIAQGTLVNVAASFSEPGLIGTRYEGRWVTDATRDEVIDRFSDFEPDVRSVIKLCDNPTKWALHILKPLPFCARKRIALIGDAAHAMTPHFGAGAGQAIDDAFVLGRLLAHPLMTCSRIPDALRIYERVRLPIAQRATRISFSTGRMYMFMEHGYYDGTRKEEDSDEREGMRVMKEVIQERWTWIDEAKSAPETWEEAEVTLRALTGRDTNS